MDNDAQTEAARAGRLDAIGAALFIALGLAVVYFSWTMPRLENRGIHPLTIPGLVPGLLGAALAVCGLVLLLRTRSSAKTAWGPFLRGLAGPESIRVLSAITLALIYSLGLVGRMPFWAATAIFVLAFILVFELWLGTRAQKPVISLAWALGIAVATAVAVTLVFERGFLVRLP